ncbi:unnamed protein product [Polarella glacialis]|uniref:Major facilitator superfamily (MFS) profile domain-containing protein n=1 Tax=Polarella glacialis TaxID=89957 RepID=A0A813HS61_POLGL|nr:unnamed protein product [Polarella glacialis]
MATLSTEHCVVFLFFVVVVVCLFGCCCWPTARSMTWPLSQLNIVLFSNFLACCSWSVTYPVAPKLILHLCNEDMALAAHLMASISALDAIVEFFANPLCGWLADRHGRKPVWLGCLCLSALANILMAVGTQYFGLFAVYLATIIAGPSRSLMTLAFAIIEDLTPQKDPGAKQSPGHSARFGLPIAAMGAAMIVAPGSGGVLFARFGLTAPFWAAAAIDFVAILWTIPLMTETLVADSASKPTGEGLGSRLAAILRSVCQLFNSRASSVLIFSYFCLLLSKGVYSTVMLFAQVRFAWTPLDTGIFMSFVGVLVVLMSGPVLGAVMPMFGEHRVVSVALVLGVVHLLGFGLASKGWQMYAVMFATSLELMANPALRAIISQRGAAGRAERGKFQGGLGAVAAIARVCGSAGFQQLFSTFGVGPRAPVGAHAWLAPGVSFFAAAAATFVSWVSFEWGMVSARLDERNNNNNSSSSNSNTSNNNSYRQVAVLPTAVGAVDCEAVD